MSITQGVISGLQLANQASEIKNRRDQLRLEAETKGYSMDNQGNINPGPKVQAENVVYAELNNRLNQIQNAYTKREMYDKFMDGVTTGNWNTIIPDIKNNPLMSNILGSQNVSDVKLININDTNEHKLLFDAIKQTHPAYADETINDIIKNDLNNTTMLKAFPILKDNQGNMRIANIKEIGAMMGMTKEPSKWDTINKVYGEAVQLMAKGLTSADLRTQELLNQAKLQNELATGELTKTKTKHELSSIELTNAKTQNELAGIGLTNAKTENARLNPDGVKPTAKMKELDAVAQARTELPKDFYSKIYVQGTPEYRQVEPTIQKIEKLMGISTDSSTRKQIAELKTAISLGAKGSKITEEEVGIIDNTVGNIKKYISNDKSSETKAAYSQAMAGIRNALFGATLSAGEAASFNEAYGTLYQKVPAIRANLKVALEGLKEKLTNYADTGDEAVTHFRLGADSQKVDRIINNLDMLINQGGVPSRPMTTNQFTPGSKAQQARNSTQSTGSMPNFIGTASTDQNKLVKFLTDNNIKTQDQPFMYNGQVTTLRDIASRGQRTSNSPEYRKGR